MDLLINNFFCWCCYIASRILQGACEWTQCICQELKAQVNKPANTLTYIHTGIQGFFSVLSQIPAPVNITNMWLEFTKPVNLLFSKSVKLLPFKMYMKWLYNCTTQSSNCLVLVYKCGKDRSHLPLWNCSQTVFHKWRFKWKLFRVPWCSTWHYSSPTAISIQTDILRVQRMKWGQLTFRCSHFRLNGWILDTWVILTLPVPL